MKAGNMTATPESVWAALQESDRQRKENERFLTEKFAETDRQLKESRAEFDRRIKENERFLREQRTETDKQLKESDRLWRESCAEYNRRMKRLDRDMGSFTNNIGAFAEEYFFNSFENGKQNFFGEKFNDIEKNVKGFEKGYKDEYDILLINGKSIGIVEVKFKAHKNDIPDIIKKAKTFRANFPNYVHHQVYLGLATMAFYPDLEQACIKKGIAVIKQVGDTVVINDAHLKVY